MARMARIERTGGPEVIGWADIDLPDPGPGEVRMRNTAIGLNSEVAESWANQALIYERRGDKAKASKSYARAVQLDPNYKPAADGLSRTKSS